MNKPSQQLHSPGEISREKVRDTPNIGLDTVAKFFAVGVGFVYSTGYLALSTFLNRFGIHEEAELFKIKYIHVGLFCILFPSFIIAPIFTFFYLRQHPGAKIKSPAIAILNIAHLFLVFYWFAIFAPPGLFHSKSIWIAGLFIWTVLLFICIRRFALAQTSDISWVDAFAESVVDPVFTNKHLKKYRVHYIRLLFFGGLCVLDFLILPAQAAFFWFLMVSMLLLKMLWRNTGEKLLHRERLGLLLLGGMASIWVCSFLPGFFGINLDPVKRAGFYYLYWILISLHLWQQRARMPFRYNDSAKPAAWFFTTCILCGFYYMSIMAFAYGIYPQIPAAKGGGNYFDSPDVIMLLDDKSLAGVPDSIVDHTNDSEEARRRFPSEVHASIPLKILEESDTVFFVADPHCNGVTPIQWSVWKMPTVIALRKECVISVSYLPEKNPY